MKAAFFLVAFLSAAMALAEGRSKNAPRPVVVELFTSEGCSSCPPADALLARLADSQPVSGARVIVLSEHVDYWNRLGWTDPYSSKQFSKRQEGYADAFQQARIYTPQMVVDGRAEFVGSDARRARQEIARAAREPKAAVELARDGGIAGLRVKVASVPPVTAGDTPEVLLAIVEDGITSDVRRGENEGRRLSHAAVVRRLEIVGAVQGSEAPFEKRLEVALDPSWTRERLRAVALVQERGSRRILGAAQLSF